MRSTAHTPEEYITSLQDPDRERIERLRSVMATTLLPLGFEEGMQFGMIGYFVPKQLYPAGYHCNTDEPLPFMALALQKQSINIYHLGLYSDPSLQSWFRSAYAERMGGKLDMGKSCIRFRHNTEIPYDLIASLCQKVTAKEWIALYEGKIKKG